MRLTWEQITLNLRNPFRLSYGTSETRQVYWIRMGDDEGWGECAIPPYYGVKTEDMLAYWQRAAQDSRPLPEDAAQIPNWVDPTGPAPARTAIDLALYDRLARRAGLPLYQFLGLPAPTPLSTSFTIAIDTPEEMARMATGVPDFGWIKMKLGSDPQDIDRVAAVRAARPDVVLRVDANAGWTRESAIEMCAAMRRYGVELIEQPLPKEDIEGLGILQRATDIPIVADESVQSMADVEKLAAAGVCGINLKLMKLGGLSTALQALRWARCKGMKIMLGCMIETSIGTTAMAHLCGLADWLDLDSPMLVSNDPFDGIHYDRHAVIQLPDRPGIGAIQKQ
jgi:L-alanine-DL-glutamate epimerase-like enolase superfamily enzyme